MTDVISHLRSVSVYHVAIFFLILSALVGIPNLAPSSQLPAIILILTAVTAALCSQAILDLLTGRKATFSEAALISGLIIGSILPPDAPLLLAALASSVAMLLKHFIRVKNIPLFNPAALGLVIVSIAIGTPTAWWAGAPFPLQALLMIVSILIISWKLRKLPMQAAFLIIWLFLWIIIGSFQLASLLSILPLYLMAFMLIEHTTSPVKLPHQLLYAAVVAAIGFAIIQSGLQFDAMLVALLAGNALTKILAVAT